MRPQWFRIDDDAVAVEENNSLPIIPFGQMWEDDIYWFPLLIQRITFAGRADFARDGDKLVFRRWWFGKDE